MIMNLLVWNVIWIDLTLLDTVLTYHLLYTVIPKDSGEVKLTSWGFFPLLFLT